MRPIVAALFFLLDASGCTKTPPSDPNDAGAMFQVRADDEGLFLTVEGPVHATYIVGGTTLEADATGHARGGIAASAPPSSGPLEVLAHWQNAGPRDAKLSVPFGPLAGPKVAITATPVPAPGGYSIDAACGGDCTGTATFTTGQTGLDVWATTGCEVRFGVVDRVAFESAPTWNPDGSVHRVTKKLPINVTDAVLKGRLPAVLVQDVAAPAILACRGRPPRELRLTFGRGAAVTAVWGQYQFVGSVPNPRGEGRDRKSALVFLDSDGFMSGLSLETDLVRYYGEPHSVSDVEIVGKLVELRHSKREVCTGDAGRFEVERSDLDLTVYDGKDRVVSHTRLVAPAVDCVVVEAQGPVRVFVGDGYDVRVHRPGGEEIGGYLKRIVGP